MLCFGKEHMSFMKKDKYNFQKSKNFTGENYVH